MEDVPKEPGHRASVSMPSLDATDDFPTPATPPLNTDQTDAEFVSTDSTFESATSTDALVPSESVLSSDSVSFSSIDAAPSENNQPVEGAPLETTSEILQQEEGLDDTQGEDDPSIAIDQFIKKIADEQLSSKRIGVQEEVNEESKETSEDLILPSENKDENIENPVESISETTKECSEKEDTEISEQSDLVPENNTEPESTSILPEEDGSLIPETTPLEQENNEVNESKQADDLSTVEPKEAHDLNSLEDTLTQDNSSSNTQLTQVEDPQPMEVESDTHTQTQSSEKLNILTDEPTQVANEVMDTDDFMQAESIEEIQKEIDKIPAKKSISTESTQKFGDISTQNGKLEENIKTNKNQNENHTQESIEQILCDDLDKSESENVKNIFGDSESALQDSSEVSRDPLLIDKAQEEMKKLDVLVCGECHNTFYYIEDFAAHKKGKCSQISSLPLLCDNEGKPQVWGFFLWKAKHIKDLGDNTPSSWSIYQKWCKLPQDDKNAWITAGQSIQFASKIGNAKVFEVKGKQNKQVLVQKVVENETLPIEFVDSNKENSDNMEVENSPSNIIKKTISKPVKLNNDVTIMPSNKSASSNSDQTNTAIRTTKILSTQKQEYVVEKIVAKRFNPRRKTWEYNIKWENFGHDLNTWEPVSNLSHCKQMLEQFEEQLKRVKEEKAKQTQTPSKGRGRPPNKTYKPNSGQYVPIAPKISSPKISNVVGGVSDDYTGGTGRPQRSSKQKALNQVKAWCGNISDEDSSGGLKRRHDDDDSDEDYDEKKIRLDEDSEDSDRDIKPKLSVKKVTSVSKTYTPVTVKNGSTGAQQILPSNILIPDANGVVRINQKQLPSLSSGVYIMSKTAGIIKLDSSTSKVATSGGQTIVKVAPKIGQTQIKIVKKEGNTTKQIIQVSPKPTITSGPIKVTPIKVTTPKTAPKIRKEFRKGSPISDVIPKLVRRVETSKSTDSKSDDESDDGLEPLPFPKADDPLPEPESPPGDFVLDPVTGKIAGREYVDKPVVIKEEPQPVATTTNDLENIVKLAAADITEDDLNNDSLIESDPLGPEIKETKPTIIQTIKSEANSSGGLVGVRRVVKYTTGQGITEGSILNKALTQGGQRAIISPVKGSIPQQRTRVVQQKVINSMVSQRTPGQTKTVVRHVIAPQGSSGNLNVIRTRTVMPKPKFNLTPQKPLPSPLQPTRTYSAMGGVRQQIGGTAANKVQVYSTKSAVGNQVTQVGGVTRKVGTTVVRTSSGQLATSQKLHPAQYGQKQQPTTRIVQRVVTTTRKSDAATILNSGLSQPMVTKITTSTKPKAVINMPSLTDDDSLISTSKLPQKSQTVLQAQTASKAGISTSVTTAIKQEPQIMESLETEESSQPEGNESVSGTEGVTDWSSFTMADGDNPIYVTGDDGTIYQVAGQNEQGQTILITQGPDGQQQCLLVTNEVGESAAEEQSSSTDVNTDSETILGISEDTTPEAETVPTTVASTIEESISTPLQIKTDSSELEGIEEGMQDQVVAQVVRAEPPSPGGTHKVVVMLPDGNLMVTQVSPEEYASLELE